VDWELLVNLADHALYAAKAAGRDRWLGLRPGPAFSAASSRDDLAKGLAANIKAKKLVLIQEEPVKGRGNLRKGPKSRGR